MGQRFWAIAIKRTILRLLVIALAGVVFDHFSNEPDERSPFYAALVALAIYCVAAIVLSLLSAISGALYLWLFADADLTGTMLDQLRAAKLPGPQRHQPKNHEYLALLADDEHAAPNDRVKAAALFGSFQAAKGSGLFRGLALTKALDNAVLRYAQEAPEPQTEREPSEEAFGERIWEQ